MLVPQQEGTRGSISISLFLCLLPVHGAGPQIQMQATRPMYYCQGPSSDALLCVLFVLLSFRKQDSQSQQLSGCPLTHMPRSASAIQNTSCGSLCFGYCETSWVLSGALAFQLETCSHLLKVAGLRQWSLLVQECTPSSRISGRSLLPHSGPIVPTIMPVLCKALECVFC